MECYQASARLHKKKTLLPLISAEIDAKTTLLLQASELLREKNPPHVFGKMHKQFFLY